MVGFGVAGVLMILLPILLLVILKKRTHAPVMPVVVGAITFVVFALGLAMIPRYLLMMTDTEIARTIYSSVWLRYAVAGVIAGVFEETGRYVAFRFVLKKHTSKITALTYGLGHGGIECIMVAVTMFSYIAIGMMVNSGNGDMIVQGLEGEQLAMVTEQLEGYATQSFGMSMLAVLERMAILFHTALSILVFKAVHDKKSRWLFPLAILFHSLLDFCIAFYASGMLSALALEIIFLVVNISAITAAYLLVYKPMPEVMAE